MRNNSGILPLPALTQEFLLHGHDVHMYQVAQQHSAELLFGCCRYRSLGIGTSQPEDVEIKRVQKLQKRFDRLHLKNAMRSNVNRNLPKNVTY